jgi:hypothetical protein
MDKWKNKRLEEIKVTEDLNMNMVYEAIKTYKSKGSNKLTGDLSIQINEKYKLKIYSIFDYSIQFSIEEEYFNVFIEPKIYKIIISEKQSFIMNIISFCQIQQLCKDYNFNELLLFCPQCNNQFFEINYENLKIHEKHKDVCLKESILIKKLSKKEFDKTFNEGFNFFVRDLKPTDFEQNFKIYFKNSDLILEENKIDIIEDKFQKRIKLFNKLYFTNKTYSVMHYFGQPGKGKTLTIIGILKYLINHIFVGTFYVNCKALSILENSNEIKQLIIDEIPYLFYNNHDDYLECAKDIIDYNYGKNSSFFELINLVFQKLINFDIKKKEYVIVFDQYNDKFDKDNKYIKQFEELLITKKNDKIKDIMFYISTFSSMNNKDIRKYKIDYLDKKINRSNPKGYNLCEIESLEYDTRIDNGGIYDQAVKKLGGGLKYYNIFKYYYEHDQEEKMIDFIDTLKLHIRKNLLDFFEMDENFEAQINLNILCCFSTDVNYSKDNILKIKDYIPFKYFDIKINEESNEYEIVFLFELVGEVLNEIYSDIININPNLYFNITKRELDGGAKGKFFEKIVTYYLNIESSIYREKKQIDFFLDYPIKYHQELEVLIPNENEHLKNVSNKISLSKGIHLLTQKRYNGRALDIALLNVSEIKEIIGIQISIRKKHIFSEDEVSKFLSLLKETVENYYDIKVDEKNLYFCYIFDWNNKNSSMIKKCQKNNIKYFYFNVPNKTFINNKYNIIKNLKPFLEGDSNPEKNHTLLEYFSAFKKNYEIPNLKMLKGPFIKINENQKKTIQSILKANIGYQVELTYQYKFSKNIFSTQFFNNKTDFCISFFIKNNEKEKNTITMITNFGKHYKIDENGNNSLDISEFSDKYDYYTV